MSDHEFIFFAFFAWTVGQFSTLSWLLSTYTNFQFEEGGIFNLPSLTYWGGRGRGMEQGFVRFNNSSANPDNTKYSIRFQENEKKRWARS